MSSLKSCLHGLATSAFVLLLLGASAASSHELVNSGGGVFEPLDDEFEEEFSADEEYAGQFEKLAYIGGSAGSYVGDVAGTINDELYLATREGSSFSYVFQGAGVGKYEFIFHWMEPTASADGERTMNVSVEGFVELEGVDIFEEAGGSYVAFSEEFKATVIDGFMNIDLTGVSGDAILSAIEVEEQGEPDPDIGVFPPLLAFGDVEDGESETAALTILNDGAETLTVSSLLLTDPAFEVVGPLPPFDVLPGATEVVTVRFTPDGLGPASGELQIGSNDPDPEESTEIVPLSGEGVEPTLASGLGINAGGEDHTDTNGQLYVMDRAFLPGSFGYVGGQGQDFGGAVAGTDDDELYNTLRGGGSFSYVFDSLDPGDYEVTLHFNEPFASSVGQRIMDVSLEGVVVLDDFDVFATAGGANIAHDEVFLVAVGDGALEVDFDVVVANNAVVSAIHVVAVEPVTPEDCGNGADDDGDGDIDCTDSDCVGDPACVEDCANAIDDDADGFVDCADSDCVGDPACVEDCTNGSDDDGDGFVDCADSDCVGDPACVEDCSNGADDDLDGDVDCADSDCAGDPACIESDCGNGADDDGDGDIDCADSDCAGDPACIEGDCGNGTDDDGDGLVDCDDPDCDGDPACVEDCANGADDDGDGLVDCDDPDCDGDPACVEDCANGADDDGDGLVDCDDSDCAGDPSCIESDCSNGVDDDGDGATDCADSDCASGPPCTEAGACADDVDNDGDGVTDCDDSDCATDPTCLPESDCDDGIDDDSDGDTDCVDSDCASDPVCDPDDDGILSPVDNCPDDWNPLQEDINGDGIGDACQPDDFDGDGWPDVDDNCPDDENQDQLDGDGNGVGDVCDGWSMARKWNEQLLHAIRNDLARPTVHARNLYHVSAAMWDAWAAYDPSVSGIFQDEDQTAGDVAAARDEAMAYAAYRVLVQRFTPSVGAETMLPRFDDKMAELGYDIAITTTIGDTPAAVGNRIAETIIAFGLTDGSNEANDYVNQYYEPVNPPLLPDFPGNPDIIDANRWQPLALEYFVDQSGNVIPGGFPEFLSPEWGQVVPFALSGEDLTIYSRDGFDYWVYHDPGPPPLLAGEGDDYYKYGTEMVSVWSSHLDPTDGVTWDISPASIGNSPLPGPDDYFDYYDFDNGGDWGTGHPINPITGLPYDPQIVPRGDYARVLAEFWADGPDSETPPGHWFSILNYVSDHPLFVKQMGGEGAVLPDLEWDVKLYLMMGGAMHDVAVTAWGAKGWYDYVRPISALRHITDLGQSSDPGGPSYHPDGIGLRPGFIEVVTAESSAPGERHEELADGIGKIAILAWRGPDAIGNEQTDTAGVGWILAENWWPYQRPSFVTPPFAGYVSGHSTFSRAASELMTVVTGSKYFPGGLGEFPAPQDEFLVFEDGPSQTITLQWATYHDASDQTSLSRIWGGIHPPADDLPGRLMGQDIGRDAVAHAQAIFGQARCSDLIDNDEDGLTDLDDPDCTDANDQSEASGPPLVERRMNCGGLDYTATNGDVFDADRAFVPGDFGYVSGEGVSFGDPVDNTDDDLLYQTMRGGPSFAYVFDALPVDDYQVTLHFNDPFASGTGQRLIDVTAEGVLVLDDLDVFDEAGGQDQAHVETFVATVTDGALDVVLDVVVSNNAILSAIEIVSLGLTLEPEDCSSGLDEDEDGLVDCDDPDCDGDPACIEGDCGNGVDDDGDGLTDCFDADCAGDPACVEDCGNGSDDDADGLTDCEDSDCEGDPACIEGDCGNGVDDDADGDIDCADADCAGDPACVEGDCGNGADDDGDGDIDCADPDCAGDPACIEGDCGNGADDDGDGDIDCADSDCAGDPACIEGDCGNGADDDGDGDIDCADSDCAGDPACEPPYEQRVNVAGDEYTTVLGVAFAEDQPYAAGSFGFIGGGDAFFGSPVDNTLDDPLYQAMRGGSSYSYFFDGLPAGDYLVTLHFNEPFASSVGQRLFDVSLEGAVALDDFDVFSEAGGQLIAHQVVLETTVNDSQLNVDLQAVVSDNAILSAIEVVGVAGAPAAPEIRVSPAAIAHGLVLLGESDDRVTTVFNDGTADLTVSSLSTTGPVFSVVGPATPFVVAPSGSQVITVRFTPDALQVEAALLQVASDDADEPVVDVALSGEGVDELPAISMFLNSGGPDYTDAAGNTFLADRAFVAGDFGYIGGSPQSFPGDVVGTTDDPLYADMRMGAAFSYAFDGLPSGDYELNLYFNEPTETEDDLRVFEVSAEGASLIDPCDVFLLAGTPAGKATEFVGTFRALRERHDVTVTDGRLDVEFTVSTGAESILSAISLETKAPAPVAGFVDVATLVGITGGNQDSPTECDPPIVTGSTWADYNGDGLVDVYLTNHGGANWLYENQGDTSGDGLPDFIDVAASAGVELSSEISFGCNFIDHDNDGDQDLFVMGWNGNSFFENQLVESGSATFVDITASTGLADDGRPVTAAWADYDGDGDLDVYLAKHFECMPETRNADDKLYRNDGGTYTDVTDQLCGGPFVCPATDSLGFTAGWFDHDDDGDLDLYIVNDDIQQIQGPNVLWRNDGSDGAGGWLFVDISASSGADASINGMGLGIGDYDNDGRMDLAFSNISPNNLFRARSDGTYEELSAHAGVQRSYVESTDVEGKQQWTWGTLFIDHDHDGWLDVLFGAGYLSDDRPLQPPAFFQNLQDGTFRDVGVSSGLGAGGRVRNMSLNDFDADGWPDVMMANHPDPGAGGFTTEGAFWLYRNESSDLGSTNGWITITVEGTVSNRDGIGTRLWLETADGVTQLREITSGPTHGGGDQRVAFFGLAAQASGELTVRWPTGVVEVIGTVTDGTQLHLLEPAGP